MTNRKEKENILAKNCEISQMNIYKIIVFLFVICYNSFKIRISLVSV